MSSPGREDPEKVQTRGEELNCVSSNLTFIMAVLNSVGANVTITSTFPLAGTTPAVIETIHTSQSLVKGTTALARGTHFVYLFMYCMYNYAFAVQLG